MKNLFLLCSTLFLYLGSTSIHAQNKTTPMMNQQPLNCDIKKGICSTGTTDTQPSAIKSTTKDHLKIIYFTDPICSSCWGIESQLRRLKTEYGDQIEIEYKMGGLLPDWNYNSGGISQPSDVAKHWDEVSPHYQMPIDGDVWLEDPLASSYPPSIAFKAAELQDKKKALLLLRELKERVFIKKQNIAKWTTIQAAALAVGLDAQQLKKDYSHKAKELFQDDLALAKQYGVRGFPTLFFVKGTQQIKVYGAKPYTTFQNAVTLTFPEIKKQTIPNTWQKLFAIYPSMTVKTYALLKNSTLEKAHEELEKLTSSKMIKKITTKNGNLYYLNK